MTGLSIEFILMLGYAIALALIAFLLELVARHAHHRSLSISTVGFTYHPDRDIWRCPEEQHLFPVFSDWSKKTVVYRAPASICNACRRKEACTDSNRGRMIERNTSSGLEYGMQRFHRAMSITLLVLASLILLVELFRAGGIYPRIILAAMLILFSLLVLRLSQELLQDLDRGQDRPPRQRGPVDSLAFRPVNQARLEGPEWSRQTKRPKQESKSAPKDRTALP